LYLFILESIGTQELILIGVIALVVFGPRKLPEMARKFGSMMADFRRVSNDFRSTWENAVSLEDSPDKQKDDSIKMEDPFEIENTIHQEKPGIENEEEVNGNASLPEIREISGDEFDNLQSNVKPEERPEQRPEQRPSKSDKTDWL
jgi:Tat protein translocase TatB subunit